MENLPKDSKICINTKKMKLQQHSAVTRADQPLERVGNQDFQPSDLGAITQSGRQVRLTAEMQQSKAQEAEQKRKKTRVREIADMIIEHALVAKEAAWREGVENYEANSLTSIPFGSHSTPKIWTKMDGNY